MCVAIIDLGTNTFNLLIAELNEESFEIIHKEKRAVKLGKNGINNGRIAEDAFLRGIDAMDYYANVISKFATQKTIATATSAMRDSVNAPDFIQAVKDKTGIEIQVISGQEEAELIFHGVEKLIPNQVNDYVIMDVGGGSTEFILVHNRELHWAKSYDLGVSRLLDWLSPSDPISQADIDKLITRLNDELSEVFEKIEALNLTTLVGCSGSFDSVHDMLVAKNKKGEPSHKLIFSEISISQMAELHNELLLSTLEQRLNWQGLVQMRADMMVVSSILMNHVIMRSNVPQLFRSDYALKEGLLFSLASEKK